MDQQHSDLAAPEGATAAGARANPTFDELMRIVREELGRRSGPIEAPSDRSVAPIGLALGLSRFLPAWMRRR